MLIFQLKKNTIVNNLSSNKLYEKNKYVHKKDNLIMFINYLI